MERRLLLALALSFLVIMLTRPLWEQQRTATAPAENKTAEQIPPAAASPPQAPPPTLSQKESGVVKKGAEEKHIRVESDLYRLTLSSKEAVIQSWVLKKYTDSNGKLLDLVDGPKAGRYGYPLNLQIDREAEISKGLKDTIFFTESPDQVLLSGSEQGSRSILFEFANENFRVIKKLTFSPGSYVVNMDSHVWVQGRPAVYSVGWYSGFGDTTLDAKMTVRRGVYRTESKVKRLKEGDIGAGLELSGNYDFAGLEDTYFAAIFLPSGNENLHRIHFGADENTLAEGKKEKLLSASVVSSSNENRELRLFVGPKDTEVLKATAPYLTEVIDYGWFRVVCEPLFLVLKWIHSYVRNYGFAIILLTILINIALFPLKYKSIVSATKMQKLQPQLKAIQDNFKKLKPTDPKRQEMNAEVMALYKKHGVNPLGGCLPLLLQMPFFIAFYNLLSVAIELRHAPFILWIKDLSAADHTYVLPILMTVSMVVMQKMTPNPTADPVQAKMMMVMPIFFGFMLAFTSSGLVLYWLTSNVVGIGQQYFLNKFGPNATVSTSQKKPKKK
ncbi:MAG: membrane protein insertase YidC [Terriglobia bacterium]